MPDILDEVKEDLKREKYAALWSRYGRYVVAGAVSAVVLTALSVSWSRYQEKHYAEQGNLLYAANQSAEEGKLDAAFAKLDTLINGKKTPAAAIAALRKAALLVKEDKVEEAMAIYKAITEDGKSPGEIRELAELLYLYNVAEKNNPERGTETAERLLKLSANSPWKFSAIELIAFGDLEKGNLLSAKENFEKLANAADAPSGIRNRAAEVLGSIVVESAGLEGTTTSKEAAPQEVTADKAALKAETTPEAEVKKNAEPASK